MIISVIIPVYNAEKTIKQSIISVINSMQFANKDYELICIDDGSTDNSLQIMKVLSNTYPNLVILTQSNSGAATARNKGLDIAKGDLIAFNDSDDIWTEDHVMQFITLFQKYPYVDCISGNHDFFSQKTYFLKRIESKFYKITLNNEMIKNYFSPPASMFRRTIIDSGIRFKTGMRYAEEGYFFYKIVKSFNCTFYNNLNSKSIYGKQKYGDFGLSGNLKGMEEGELYNLEYAYKKLGINLFYYIFAVFFSRIKYLRRLIIVKIRGVK